MSYSSLVDSLKETLSNPGDDTRSRLSASGSLVLQPPNLSNDIHQPPPFTNRGYQSDAPSNANTPPSIVPGQVDAAPLRARSPLGPDTYNGSGIPRIDLAHTLPPDIPFTNTFPTPETYPSWTMDLSLNQRSTNLGRTGSTNSQQSAQSSLRQLPSSSQAMEAVCDQCGRESEHVSFCPVCAFNYCREHWDNQLLHRQQRSVNGVPHEKTNPHLAQKIRSIIEPSTDEEEQEELHRADDDTIWFGVLPDQSGQLTFHDFGRYEEFLAQSSFSPQSAQFPSLISFVGKTGVGKSTIVKGLVRLYSSDAESERHQAPVVGMTQHQEVPTSGEVHLYWDPKSLLTNRPLMYADCEGLGAGSQTPMSARATADRQGSNRARGRSIFENRSHITPSRSLGSNSYSPGAPSTEHVEGDRGWTSRSAKNFRGVTWKILWAQEAQQRSREFIVENLYPRLLYTFSDIVVLVMRNAK
jgi:hypothetical protein